MVLCMVSMFSGHALDPHLAMTGEMTLRGKVTPIGGVKEKVRWLFLLLRSPRLTFSHSL
jgi:ATP-dependent Lon protease